MATTEDILVLKMQLADLVNKIALAEDKSLLEVIDNCRKGLIKASEIVREEMQNMELDPESKKEVSKIFEKFDGKPLGGDSNG